MDNTNNEENIGSADATEAKQELTMILRNIYKAFKKIDLVDKDDKFIQQCLNTAEEQCETVKNRDNDAHGVISNLRLQLIGFKLKFILLCEKRGAGYERTVLKGLKNVIEILTSVNEMLTSGVPVHDWT